MKKIICTLLIFLSQHSDAQETKEDFINKVVKTQSFLSLDSLPGYYYLLQATVKIDMQTLKWGMKNLNTNIPKNVERELFKQAVLDTMIGKWDCGNLKGGKCIVDTFTLQAGLPYYRFSKPEFDKNFLYALIQVNYGYSKSNIGGWSIWLFYKKNGKWENLSVLADNEY